MPDPATPSEPSARGETPRRRRWGKWWKALAAVLVLVLGAGLYWWHWIHSGRIYTVHGGRLYRCAALPADGLTELCRKYGVRTVIDVRVQKDLADAEAKVLAEMSVRHVHLPSNQVPKPHVVAGFLRVMDDPENWPVLVHCTHGVGRTGVLAAIYRMEYQGWSNARARLEAMALAGFDSFRKDTGKGRFLLDYRPRAKRATP